MSDCAAFFLVGPTAVGKTAVAHHLARTLDYDIVSADSMLVYRGMDIGTAKPTAAELEEVKYYGIDLASPEQPFTAHDYTAAALDGLAEINSSDRKPIVAGGTGLYVKSLIFGLSKTAPPDPSLREKLELLLKEHGVLALQERLKDMSPNMYSELRDKENPRRLIRAIEMSAHGLVNLPEEWRDRDRPRLCGLRMDPVNLKERIRTRVMRMYEEGLIEEARALFEAGFESYPTASQAIGYAEVIDHIKGKCTLDEAKENTITRTNRLAKHQHTWFRNQAEVEWIDIEMNTQPEQIAEAVLKSWEKNGATLIKLR